MSAPLPGNDGAGLDMVSYWRPALFQSVVRTKMENQKPKWRTKTKIENQKPKWRTKNQNGEPKTNVGEPIKNQNGEPKTKIENQKPMLENRQC